MSEFLVGFIWEFRGIFSRRAAFAWFVVVFAGLVLRTDWLGVTSIVRTLELSPAFYPHLLHFFHASSWKGEDLCKQASDMEGFRAFEMTQKTYGTKVAHSTVT